MASRTTRYDERTAPAPPADRPARRTAYDLTRALFTLTGAAGAGFLVWLAAHLGHATPGRWWISMAILAGAGLALALSQLFGGWTKWGLPRLSGPVFLFAFVPAAVCVAWILLTTQPDGGWQHGRLTHWSSSLGILGLVKTLGRYAPALALGLGSLFGYTFDTTGPRRRTHDVHRTAVLDRRAADEPLTAERTTTRDRDGDLATTRRGTPVAPQPDTADERRTTTTTD